MTKRQIKIIRRRAFERGLLVSLGLCCAAVAAIYLYMHDDPFIIFAAAVGAAAFLKGSIAEAQM